VVREEHDRLDKLLDHQSLLPLVHVAPGVVDAELAQLAVDVLEDLDDVAVVPGLLLLFLFLGPNDLQLFRDPGLLVGEGFLADAAGVIEVKALPPLVHELGKRSLRRRSLHLGPFPSFLEIGTNRILEGFVPAEGVGRVSGSAEVNRLALMRICQIIPRPPCAGHPSVLIAGSARRFAILEPVAATSPLSIVKPCVDLIAGR